MFKKFVLAVLAVAFCMHSTAVFADDDDDDDTLFFYEMINGIRYYFPSELQGAYAYIVKLENDERYTLSEVEIPDLVTHIERVDGDEHDPFDYWVFGVDYAAFYGSPNLTSISFGPHLQNIRGQAFEQCTKLTTFTLPSNSGLEIIYDNGFKDCSSLQNFSWSHALRDIRSSAFEGCTSLTSVSLLENMNTVGKQVFKGCTALKTVTISEHLSSIGEAAFEGCYNLETINMPSTLNSLGRKAFYGCSSLSSTISLTGNIATLPDSVFTDCSKLTTLSLPSTLTEVKKDAFKGCTSLSKIECFATTPPTISDGIPESLLPGITLYVPFGAMEAYKADPVWGKMNIKALKFKSGNFYYNMTSATTAELTYDDGSTYNTYSGVINNIPSTVENLGHTLMVDKIGDSAFRNCEGVTSVDLPGNIKSVGDYAFYGCTSIDTITLSGNTASLGSYAFYGCTGLRYINNLRFNPATLGSQTFGGIESLNVITMHVPSIPDDVSGRYLNVNVWKDMFVIPQTFDVNGLKYRSENGTTAKFMYWAPADHLVIPETVAHKGHTMPVTEISDCAFVGTTAQSVSLPKTITTVGHTPFMASSVKTLYLYSPTMTLPSDFLGSALSLQEIYNYADTPEEAPEEGFGLDDEALQAIHLYVNDASVEQYKAATGWKQMNVKSMTVLNDGDTYERLTERTYPQITYKRQFDDTNWHPLYVPFDMSYNDWKDNFEVAAFKNVEEQYENPRITIYLEKVTNGGIRHNTPYLIRSKYADKDYINVSGVTLYPAVNDSLTRTSDDKELSFVFTGTYQTLSALEDYYSDANNKNQLVFKSEVSTLSPYRWYLNLKDEDGIVPEDKIITLDFADADKVGDVNQDGKVDVGDMTIFINALLNSTTVPNADVNHDNNVNLEDVNALLKVVLTK